MGKFKRSKSSKRKKKAKPKVDGFLEYLCYKHSNGIGAEYGGMNGPRGTGPIFEKT